ncbi:serine/threonine-protein kinase BLUS1 [Populus trichocarpa]|uniref:serine/threonine-protein kinase BLUS1 n=1 Tax=Populus trichocarpa TaxID=3694 RepID=UPI000D18ACB4|nr:serine/threonine-protein kinase BLUS1 [Populus trichocarpa]|eukprot:XP_024453094.1 serine/threonine-protein kinase BLUS1 isoform X4 [Populus trichocarpa]
MHNPLSFLFTPRHHHHHHREGKNKDLRKTMEKKKYPIGPENYVLYEEIGQGATASVHRALCVPFNEIVAIKILDFERDNADLRTISREVQTMILVDHPNVLKSHCSFVSDHNLWVVMPYMSGGSCLHILKAAYPDGFEELVIATILREVLKGIDYLHHQGYIHRDVKAGNILVDGRGAVKLGDFGVSACLFDSGDRQRTRNTFVGTPCWMAPEVMEQLNGYDFKADIWSFGITALELAHGHAPFSKYPPMKVLLMTLQNAPPGLDLERDKKFSKSFKQMIASCLVKDPSKRPSANKLLKHSFFKQARSNDYIVRKLLDGLPDLGDRIRALKRKEEDMLAQQKMPDGEKEELSQNEYKRGLSDWNFNLEDVKAQASLIPDSEDPMTDNNLGESLNSLPTLDGVEKQSDTQNSSLGQVTEMMDDNDVSQNRAARRLPLVDSSLNIAKVRFVKSDDDSSTASPCHERHVSQNSSPGCDSLEGNAAERPAFNINGKPSEKLQNQPPNSSNINGATIVQDGDDGTSENPSKALHKPSGASSYELDEKAKPPVVQQRGRFKVTSENVDIEKALSPQLVLQKSYSMQVRNFEVFTQHPGVSLPSISEAIPSTLSGHSQFPILLSVLQTNITQRDGILYLMRQISGGDTAGNQTIDGGWTTAQGVSTEKSLAPRSSS